MRAASDTEHINVAARIPFQALGFSRLFTDYCRNEPVVWSYFPAGNSLDEAEEIGLRTAAARPINRELLGEVLEEQNRGWDCSSATLKNIAELQLAGSVCAVTGQQLGIFVSPLYTIYKAITAIQLARKWTAAGIPAVPVFWLADEDHDFDEVATTYVPSGDALARVGLNVDAGNEPVGRRVLDSGVTMVEQALADALPSSPFCGEVLSAVRDCYRVGVSHRDAFARLLHRLLPDSGLVVMSADDARFKRAASPMFEREFREGRLYALLADRTAQLEETYHAQVKPRDTNVFYVDSGQRLAIDRVEGGFLAGSKHWKIEAILEELRDSPERFSPNVVLRPIMQDMLLPTAAYVAGPGELAYYAQLGPAYAWANVEMPFIKPRASVSLVDNASVRVMREMDLKVPDLSVQPDQLFASLVRKSMPPDIGDAFDDARTSVDRIVDELKSIATSVEPTLDRTSEAARTRVNKQIDRLHEKVERAERRKHAELRRRLGHAQRLLFPTGSLQERTISPLYFEARYGLGFFERLVGAVSLDTTEHQVFVASDI